MGSAWEPCDSIRNCCCRRHRCRRHNCCRRNCCRRPGRRSLLSTQHAQDGSLAAVVEVAQQLGPPLPPPPLLSHGTLDSVAPGRAALAVTLATAAAVAGLQPLQRCLLPRGAVCRAQPVLGPPKLVVAAPHRVCMGRGLGPRVGVAAWHGRAAHGSGRQGGRAESTKPARAAAEETNAAAAAACAHRHGEAPPPIAEPAPAHTTHSSLRSCSWRRRRASSASRSSRSRNPPAAAAQVRTEG